MYEILSSAQHAARRCSAELALRCAIELSVVIVRKQRRKKKEATFERAKHGVLQVGML